jgi:hypothetical protein
MNMRKQYTLEPARIMDIQGDPSKYLPIAMYAIGCHMGEMTNEELEGLMYALSTELRERELADEFTGVSQWENTQNVAYCEGHDFT